MSSPPGNEVVTSGYEATVRETVSPPEEMVKVSPAVYGFAVMVPENRKLPAEMLSQAVKNVALAGRDDDSTQAVLFDDDDLRGDLDEEE